MAQPTQCKAGLAVPVHAVQLTRFWYQQGMTSSCYQRTRGVLTAAADYQAGQGSLVSRSSSSAPPQLRFRVAQRSSCSSSSSHLHCLQCCSTTTLHQCCSSKSLYNLCSPCSTISNLFHIHNYLAVCSSSSNSNNKNNSRC